MAQIVEVIGVGNVEFPDGMSKEQIGAALQKLPKPKFEPTAQNRGNVINTDVPTVVGSQPNAVNPQPPVRPVSMMDRVKSLYEVPTAIVSGAAAPFLGVGAGIAENIMQGTSKRVDSPEFAQRFQYQPTSPVSQDILQTMGSALEASKIPPFIGSIGAIPSFVQKAPNVAPVVQESVMPTANRMAGALRNEGQMIQEAVQPVTNRVTQAVEPVTARIAEALRKEPTMSGVGAAAVPEAVTRVEMAKQLRVPGKLTKGMAERELGQQQFESDIAKQYPDTIGKPLIVAKAEANDTILQNFDAFVDATGKETFGLRETGKVVDAALVKQAKEAKDEINKAYKLAREAGETQELIPYGTITQYIEKQTPTVRAKLAPILDAVDEQLKLNDPDNLGQISINQLDDVYKFINQNFDPSDAVGMMHAGEMKRLINAATADKGGKLYQTARSLRTAYGNQFEDVGAVDKLLRTKKGTTDRAVAFEDVFRHSILDGSRDDVAAIGLTLKKGGPQGQQAWKELQGQTIQHIKDKVTSSIDVDSFGNPVVSPAKFKSVLNEIDQDGKLDYIFGKKGAEEIRNLYDYTFNVNAPLKGAVNYSNTASAIMRGLDAISLLPLSRVIGVKQGLEKIKESQIKKQVKESVDYEPGSMADELRKGNKP
jgi:hypothetical protein